MFRRRDELEGEDYKKFWDISLTCNLEQYDTPFNSTQNITDKDALNSIRSVASPLGILAEIKWQGKTYAMPGIRQLFTEHITQEGVCFTFNTLSQEDMYSKEMNHEIVLINHTMKNSGWTLENGYPSGSSILNNHPRRTARDGSGSGLIINLFHIVIATDYICGPMVKGYKVLLHNPAEIPRPKQQYFLVPLQKQSTFTVKPEMTTTSENLRSMPSSARKCYFSDEKSLRFFKVYTQNNCQTECAVNVTQHLCGCVPFYMPHDNETPICGFGRMDCVAKTEIQIVDFGMIENGVNASSEMRQTEAYKIFERCNCEPSCSDLQFSAETSQTEAHIVQSVLASGLFDNNTDLIFTLNSGLIQLTQIDIFFKESQFLALHRSELYGQTDFLANCGGLLGLFMGFSLLSLIEILYFMTIRLWIKWKSRESTKL